MYLALFRSLSDLRKKLEPLIFPYHCVLCLCPSDTERDLCLGCENALPRLTKGCCQCGHSFMGQTSHWMCGRCLKDPPAYDGTLALFEYASPVDQFILRLKFKKKLLYARLLGELMAEAIAQHYQNQPLPECMIPIPLHPRRLRERGFNQAIELARPIAKKMRIPLMSDLYIRSRHTQQQSNIPMDQRKQNVQHVFEKRRHHTYQSVAIVDDVMTTGYTVDALSQRLKSDGVQEVTIWCCARTCLESVA